MEFIDLAVQYHNLQEEIDSGIKNVLLRGQFIMGQEVESLERQLESFINRKHCIVCGNGTDALQILYMAYGIGNGDAIFCPDVTFIASIEPACLLGATPIFCDIDEKTYNICPDSLERQIQKVRKEGKLNPKLVVAVDFLGNPANYKRLYDICERYDLILIEDAAQGIGATYDGKSCGSFGHSSTTSFFPSKPLGCYGDGGAIFTDDDMLEAVCRSIQVHGRGTSKYDNIRIGINSRLDTIQASILLTKLKAFKAHEIKNRSVIAQKYDSALGNKYVVPYIEPNASSIYAQYALRAADFDSRESIMNKLKNNGIPCMIYYPTPMHKLKVFQSENYNDCDFPNSNHYCDTTFSIPMHAYLTKEQQEFTIKTLLSD